MLTRRAGCLARGSPSSTEALRSNPLIGASERRRSAREPIPKFYPMDEDQLPVGWGRQRQTSVNHTGAAIAGGVTNPPRGFGPKPVRATRVKVPSGSFNLGRRGELPTWQQAGPGRDWLGDGAKHPAAKSSTMKGPKGLAGKQGRRRSRTAKSRRRWVRGCFCVLSPEIAPSGRKRCPAGRLEHTTPDLEGITS
jgi:hypothetical protein